MSYDFRLEEIEIYRKAARYDKIEKARAYYRRRAVELRRFPFRQS